MFWRGSPHTAVMAMKTLCFCPFAFLLVACFRPPLPWDKDVSPLLSFILFVYFAFFPFGSHELVRLHAGSRQACSGHPAIARSRVTLVGPRASAGKKVGAMPAPTAVGGGAGPSAGGRQALSCDAPGPCVNHSQPESCELWDYKRKNGRIKKKNRAMLYQDMRREMNSNGHFCAQPQASLSARLPAGAAITSSMVSSLNFRSSIVTWSLILRIMTGAAASKEPPNSPHVTPKMVL